MIINRWYSPPTVKQVQYAQEISSELKVPLPEEKTFDGYKEYLNHWAPLYQMYCDELRQAMEDQFDYY